MCTTRIRAECGDLYFRESLRDRSGSLPRIPHAAPCSRRALILLYRLPALPMRDAICGGQVEIGTYCERGGIFGRWRRPDRGRMLALILISFGYPAMTLPGREFDKHARTSGAALVVSDHKDS